MNKNILAIFIGLALAGCNSSSNSAPKTNTQTKTPVATISKTATSNTPSSTKTETPKITPSESIKTPAKPTTKASPSTVESNAMATQTKATAISQPANTLPIATLNTDYDTVFKSSGIPEGITQIPKVNCSETFSSLTDLTAKAKELTSIADKAIEEAQENGTTATNVNKGKTLCLADGEYTNGGSKLNLKINGFTVAAEHSGAAKIKDIEVAIAMSGENSVLQGFIFDKTGFGGAFIQTRGNHSLPCNDCRITEVSILSPNPLKDYGNILKIYGHNVWFDHSIISGKTNANPMISFVREKGLTEAQKAKNIVVYKNYIANRPPVDGKIYPGNDNDYEAIRTGLSETHGQSSHSFVVGNFFEYIQGEAEVVSNKASDNTISFNTIRNSYGSLTNRHGHNNKIENNFIIGDGYPQSGGIRIVDAGHQVNNNYIEGARYLGTTHHGGIVLLGSDSHSDSGTGNGYQPVKNVHITNNTIVDSVNSLNLDGGGKKYQPTNVFIENNIVDKAIGSIFRSSDRGLPPDSEILGNFLSGATVADTDKITIPQLANNHFESAGLERSNENGLFRPTTNSPSLNVAITADNKGNVVIPAIDMDGQRRSDPTFVGADEINNKVIRTIQPLSFADVGPVNYKVDKPEPIVVTAPIKNSNFSNWTENWTGDNATTITGVNAFSGKTLQLDNNGAVTQDVAVLPNHHYVMSAFVKGSYALSVEGTDVIKDNVAKGNISGDQYKWVKLPFDSGSNDQITVSLAIPKTVTVNADVVDADFSDYKNGHKEGWTEHKDNADVGSSSDSAFSAGGSARMRFKHSDDATNDFTSEPSISQVVTGLPENTDVTFSIYYCNQMKDDAHLASLHFGAREVAKTSLAGNILSEANVHTSDLKNAPSGSKKDCFKKATTSFNTGANTSVEIFAGMAVAANDIDAVKASAAYNNGDSGKFEIRVDNPTLSYEGPAAAGLVGNFDEVRIATRTDQKIK
ncbi:chondroitinase-B domain-containing protein [Vibrio rarus]|uniref:chondroitinase-B domain-containing protein n=1 Tax=Vibrio rarus TaxID=413403 RepID=UPI0021C2D70E|nr:chondroitinase-B domain-containing protein [Vibrio rarus]